MSKNHPGSDAVLRARVGKRIADAREAVFLTQAELGKKMDPPRSHAAVSDIEMGKTHLDITLLVQLGYLLSKPLTYFYGELDLVPPDAAGPLTQQRIKQLANWCRETCLLFGTETSTAHKVAGEFAAALEKLL